MADNIKIYSRILNKKTNKFNQVKIYNSDLKSKVNIATINKYLALEKNISIEIHTILISSYIAKKSNNG